MVGEKEKRITKTPGHGRNPVGRKLAVADGAVIMIEAGDVVPDVVGGKQAGMKKGKQAGDGENTNDKKGEFDGMIIQRNDLYRGGPPGV